MSDLKCDKPKRMTAEEHAIWTAVYAAEYVRRFGRALDYYAERSGQTGDRGDFDRAIDDTTAENPIYVANAAVNDLRKWRRDHDHA